MYLGTIKVTNDLKAREQSIHSTNESFIQEEEKMKITAHLNSIKVFDQVSPSMMAEEHYKVPVLAWYVLAGDKLRPADVVRAACRYLLQYEWLMLKRGVLNHLYVNNDGR